MTRCSIVMTIERVMHIPCGIDVGLSEPSSEHIKWGGRVYSDCGNLKVASRRRVSRPGQWRKSPSSHLAFLAFLFLSTPTHTPRHVLPISFRTAPILRTGRYTKLIFPSPIPPHRRPFGIRQCPRSGRFHPGQHCWEWRCRRVGQGRRGRHWTKTGSWSLGEDERSRRCPEG